MLGGRRIPIRAAVIPAAFGAAAVTLLCAYGVEQAVLGLVTPEQARALSLFDVPAHPNLEPPEGWVPAAYALLLAWGPLLGAVTVAYHRRRTRAATAFRRGRRARRGS